MGAPRVLPVPRKQNSKSLHVPAANTPAVVTLTAVAGQRRAIRALVWSYNAAPTNGGLFITDNAVEVINFDITGAGPGIMFLEASFGVNTEVKVTLNAGGGTVAGKLSVIHYLIRD